MRTIDRGGGGHSDAIMMSIDELRQKSAALEGLAGDLTGSIGSPPGGETAAAQAAARTAVTAIQAETRAAAKNLRAMLTVLDKRVNYMREFNKDYPSTFATAADARAFGKKLATEYRRSGDISVIAKLDADPDAAYSFFNSLRQRDINELLMRDDYTIDDYKQKRIVYEAINVAMSSDLNDESSIRRKFATAIDNLDPQKSYRALGLLTSGIGADEDDEFRPDLVGLVAADLFSKIHLLDGEDDLGGSERRRALDLFLKAVARDDVSGSILSHADTLGNVISADVVTKDNSFVLVNEDLSRGDFLDAAMAVLKTGWDPPSEAKYDAITNAVNGRLPSIINDPERSLPNEMAQMLAGALTPYIINPEFAAARLSSNSEIVHATMQQLGQALATLGQGGGAVTREAISAYLEVAQVENNRLNGNSALGATNWAAMDAMRNQIDAYLTAHGSGLKTFENAEDLGRVLSGVNTILGASNYVPVVPFVVSAYGSWASGQIDSEADRLEMQAQYAQELDEYMTRIDVRHSQSDINIIAQSLADRTPNAPADFVKDLVIVMTAIKAEELRQL